VLFLTVPSFAQLTGLFNIVAIIDKFYESKMPLFSRPYHDLKLQKK